MIKCIVKPNNQKSASSFQSVNIPVRKYPIKYDESQMWPLGWKKLF
jgi:hypothetical protein